MRKTNTTAADPFQSPEPKAQRWRAVAVLVDETEALLCVGESFTRVKDCYPEAFFEGLDLSVQKVTKKVAVQKFVGRADSGRWQFSQELPVPKPQTPKAVPA